LRGGGYAGVEWGINTRGGARHEEAIPGVTLNEIDPKPKQKVM
jgi:hypothetical protein